LLSVGYAVPTPQVERGHARIHARQQLTLYCLRLAVFWFVGAAWNKQLTIDRMADLKPAMDIRR